MALAVPQALLRQRLGQGVLGQRESRSTVIAIPPPVGGWNARDSLDGMDPADAIRMDNWMPGLGRVDLRPGYTSHATGVGSAAVETVVEYNNGTARKLLAASDDSVYDASSAGAVGSALLSSMSNGRWQTTHLGATQIWCNAEDQERSYNGTAFSAITFTGTNRPTAGTCTVVHAHKRRLYAAVDAAGVGSGGPGDFYYSSTDGSFTAMEVFPLSQIVPRGGRLVNIMTVSRDSAIDTSDFIAFVYDSGMVAVYAGENPDSAGWALVGLFDLGGAVSPRMAAKVGADAVIGTRDGYSSLSTLLRTARTDPSTMLSHKIADAVRKAIDRGGIGAFGWQVMHYPARGWMIVNVPTSSTTFEQHVLNLVTGAWGRFTGIAASAWTLFNDVPYFGGPGGIVYKFDANARSDAGMDIVGILETAFNYFGDRGRLKKLTALRPIVDTEGQIDLSVSIATDFSQHETALVETTIAQGEGNTPWGSPWGSPWSSGIQARAPWIGQAAQGYAFSTRLRVAEDAHMVAITSLTYDMLAGGAW